MMDIANERGEGPRYFEDKPYPRPFKHPEAFHLMQYRRSRTVLDPKQRGLLQYRNLTLDLPLGKVVEMGKGDDR